MAEKRTFIDLCAGCGGLSLGLIKAGWRGLFAVEKNKLAFSTLSHNLLGPKQPRFEWPDWLAREAISIEDLVSKHTWELKNLEGKLDLLAGGPPCQGFSTVGRRVQHDPRNRVFKHYLELVRLTRPGAVLMENVRGILYPFKAEKAAGGETPQSPIYAELIKTALEEELEYRVWYAILQAKDYGVPQTRPRFILMGVRKDLLPKEFDGDPFKTLSETRENFLQGKNLGTNPISTRDALKDLCKVQSRLHECEESPRFKQGAYGTPKSDYQKLMHGDMNGALADSHRFANHRPETVEKFQWLLQNCSKGKILRPEDRGAYSNSKHTVYILDPDQPAPTVTTLPDDILHFSEPRILTVRELARLQSFPDWFEFKGKYTTGSTERVKECPRYTQVGNAVPPLLAEALGGALRAFLDELPALTP